jgi:hypothetical protein
MQEECRGIRYTLGLTRKEKREEKFGLVFSQIY